MQVVGLYLPLKKIYMYGVYESNRVYMYTRFWPLRAAARSTHERGGTGHRTMVETRVVHEYQ